MVESVETVSGLKVFAIRAVWLGWLLTSGICYAADHKYTLRFSESLDRISVEAHLTGGVTTLEARRGETRELDSLADCNGARLRARRNEIRLKPGQICVRYDYPLRSSSERDSSQRVELADDVFVTSPSEWLWIPRLEKEDRIFIELRGLDHLNVSVPWDVLDDRNFVLGPSPQSSRSNVIVGKFRTRKLDLPGAELRVALLDGATQTLREEKIITWLDAAARDVAGVYGRFPNPSPQIIVMAGGPGRRGSGSAVPFGHVIRDGGEAVRFFVNNDKPLNDYLGDWTATHEFAHLLLPYIESEQKWISEGFASYYQNVLLARRGVYSEADAWRRLNRSFNRARSIDNPPSPNNTSKRSFWEVRMLVYWSGAAIALLADAELREVSEGKESLDTVLGRLQSCCLPSHRVWRGRDFFSKLDELSQYKIFGRLYDEHANSKGMPDMTELFGKLGIQADGDKIQLSDLAPLVHVRRSIMEHPSGNNKGE